MSTTDQLTTAQLRSLAYDAEQDRQHLKAAELYEAALAAYPSHHAKSVMHREDKASLAARAFSCRGIAKNAA